MTEAQLTAEVNTLKAQVADLTYLINLFIESYDQDPTVYLPAVTTIRSEEQR
jgi:hypothetical protein